MTTELKNNEIIISVKGLEKHFGGGDIKALRGVDTDIHKGEVLVVIGPSGSGKSTFLRCLNLLEMPTAGTITFEGVNITDPKVNINVHRQKMGMVFQHFNLFPHMTVLKNMTIAPIQLLKKEQGRSGTEGDGAAGAGEPGGPRRRLSQPAVRRTEAADRHCAGPVHEAGGDAL